MTPHELPGAPRHLPVMRERIVELLAPALQAPGSVVLDCTLGLGGHALALLEACPQARLIGIDRDREALAIAADRLVEHRERIELVPAVYDQIAEVVADHAAAGVQAIVADLGLSSLQIDTAERGFAYAHNAPLDMRMDQRGGISAAEVLNTYSRSQLSYLLKHYGEERFADRIAAAVVAEREREPFTHSARLVQVIGEAIPAAARFSGTHWAKRTFQALRIEVNDELGALHRALPAAVASLSLGGRIAVLAYHSLEDRPVKQLFVDLARDRAPRHLPVIPPQLAPELKLLTRGAERPQEAEIEVNPRAASARLRAAERIKVAIP